MTLTALERKYYRYGMMRAIHIAAGAERLTSGLRVIRRFEKVNFCKFDPFDDRHLNLVANMGRHEAFFREARRVLK